MPVTRSVASVTSLTAHLRFYIGVTLHVRALLQWE